MSEQAIALLKEWLRYRESDIACGIEDLGELKVVFLEVMGREAKYKTRRLEAIE